MSEDPRGVGPHADPETRMRVALNEIYWCPRCTDGVFGLIDRLEAVDTALGRFYDALWWRARQAAMDAKLSELLPRPALAQRRRRRGAA